jgi:hypothetical protein
VGGGREKKWRWRGRTPCEIFSAVVDWISMKKRRKEGRKGEGEGKGEKRGEKNEGGWWGGGAVGRVWGRVGRFRGSGWMRNGV